jgi:hypothetical protein
MHAPPKFLLEFLQLGTRPLSHGLPKHDEPSMYVLVTCMCESQEIEGFRLTTAMPFSNFLRMATKFNQAGFRGMQFQVELLKSFLKLSMELLGFLAILKANHKVICEAHDHYITVCLLLSPLVGPQVEHIVQVDVRQQGRNTTPLG